MTRLFKTLLICLLALVLPAQAIASAAKSCCGPRHHAVSELSSAKRVTESHDLDADMHHGAAQASVDTDKTHGAASDDAGTSAAGHLQYKSSYCSACAACCIGAAVVPAMSDWTPPSRNSFIPIISPPHAITAHIPAGLERPPRLISL